MFRSGIALGTTYFEMVFQLARTLILSDQNDISRSYASHGCDRRDLTFQSFLLHDQNVRCNGNEDPHTFTYTLGGVRTVVKVQVSICRFLCAA
jgi:hypothetical protein